MDVTDNDGATPLHVAVAKGRRMLVDVLIGHGANVNARTNIGLTPLRAAILAGRKDIANLLLQHGATPETDI